MKSNKSHIYRLAHAALGFGVLGIACKLGFILGGNYYWPVWPNIIDVSTLILASLIILKRR